MTYQRSVSVLQQDVEGKLILLHTTRWEYMEFNAQGAAIWELFNTPQSLESLVAKLRADFDVDEETCRLETGRLLDQLLSSGYIVPAA
ncbi:hypothetical protein Terro_1115 [Terriglobus roseus DSM 18391]|uniref:Coenzyme PQQ synthesis protein D (PqqD) n=1 Tax=Terriglobus roseus (strain DSM 18391 / NRRL B-41598 / KBS 63) TaxID=926566 RepID=I3ZDW6_TERRK|nr:PqqD family protein [Terriglobus roseus]AFL87434.1 hypothetical protein Terro_1115 [Terriglobus roseus DSM 18391]